MPDKNIAPLSAFPEITTAMIEELQMFTEVIQPAVFRDQLVSLYLQFVMSSLDGFPTDFQKLTHNLYFFIAFLTHLQEAMDDRE